MKRGSIFQKILLILVCALLVVALGAIVFPYRQQESLKAREWQKEAEKARAKEKTSQEEKALETELSSQGSDAAEEDSEGNAEAETSVPNLEEDASAAKSGQATDESGEDTDKAEQSSVSKSGEETAVSVSSSSSESSSSSSVPDEEEESRPAAVSCRGDAFQRTDGADKATGYPARLVDLMNKDSVTCKVYDYTWDMAGSLSQLRLAGVSKRTTDNYIIKHQEAAAESGISTRLTDVQIRIDFDEVDTSREDELAIPVICIGYNGGFGGDLEELVEQQQLLLDTFDLAKDDEGEDKFVVMGFYPSGWEDPGKYDDAMEKAWGKHYLPLNDKVTVDAMSDEGREMIAEAVYEKLKELSYI